MLTQSEITNAIIDVFRLAASSVELGNTTVIYLGGTWSEELISQRGIEKYAKLLKQDPILECYRRFQAGGGILWVSAYQAQKKKLHERHDLITGVIFVDERKLLEFLAEDTICLQY
jgi:hypothetical protein